MHSAINPRTPSRPTLYLFSTSHALHDLYTGVWVLILAAQVILLDLSYTQAGIAQAAYTVTSAIAQPSFGGFFDRTGKPYLALWSVAFTTFMVALSGIVGSYPLLLLVSMGAGLGSAAFHSAGLSGAKQLAAGRGDGRATAIFLLGGNGGYAIGYYVGGVVLDDFGAKWLMLPALVIMCLTPLIIRRLRPFLDGIPNQPERSTREVLMGGRTVWFPIMAYILIMFGYQAFQTSFSVYLPQFYVEQGNSLSYAGLFSFLLLLFAAVGSFAGGVLSDLLPRRQLAIGSMLLVAPLSYLVLRTSGELLIGVSIVLGLLTNVALPILLLIGQEVLPGGKSAASGYAFGLTFLTRAIAAPILGAVADEISLLTTMTIAGFLPLSITMLFFLLPRGKRL